jgi:hypothetical protein
MNDAQSFPDVAGPDETIRDLAGIHHVLSGYRISVLYNSVLCLAIPFIACFCL